VRAVWILTCVLACSGAGSSPEAGPAEGLDPIRAGLAVADQSTEVVRDAIVALPSSVEQLAALLAYARAYPDRLYALCPTLPEGVVRLECLRRQGRGHLWKANLDRTAPLTLEVAKAEHAKTYCADAVDWTSCVEMRAIESAQRGDGEAAIQACAMHTDPVWARECAFLSAEALLFTQGTSAYADAATVCTASGSYRTACLDHLLMFASGGQAHPGRPSAAVPHTTDAAQWASALSTADAVRASSTVNEFSTARGRVTDGDPRPALRHVNWYWALWFTRRYLSTPADRLGELTAVVREGTPAEVPPHIRAGAAWRVVRYSAQPASGLAEWGQWVRQVLEGRTEGLDIPVVDLDPEVVEAVKFKGVGPIASTEEPLPDGAHSTLFGGRSERLVSTKATTDIAIVVLESAARDGWAYESTHLQALIAEGLAHRDASVRWTACRISKLRFGEDGSEAHSTAAALTPAGPCAEILR
jgi:hypothetical protein